MKKKPKKTKKRKPEPDEVVRITCRRNPDHRPWEWIAEAESSLHPGAKHYGYSRYRAAAIIVAHMRVSNYRSGDF